MVYRYCSQQLCVTQVRQPNIQFRVMLSSVIRLSADPQQSLRVIGEIEAGDFNREPLDVLQRPVGDVILASAGADRPRFSCKRRRPQIDLFRRSGAAVRRRPA